MSAVLTLPSAPVPASKTGLLKRITTKLRTPQPTASTSAAPAEAAPSKPKRRGTVLPRPKAPVPALPNTFISAEQREAALLARGLVPRRLRDAHGERLPMSAQEAARDERLGVRPDSDSGSTSGGGSDSEASEARRIRADWLARNDGAAAPRRASDEELAQSRTSLSAAAADERGVVIGTPAAPRRPRIVRAHEPPPLSPLSPSQAELATSPSSASGDTDSLDRACDPTRVPLPPSPAASLWGVEIARGDAEAHASGEGTAEADAGAARDTAGAPAERAPANSRAPGTASAAASAIEADAQAASPPPSFDDPRSPRDLPAPLPPTMSTHPSPSPIERGRSFGGASATSVPALSPTRTASSSSTEPQTPHLDDARPRSASTASVSGESWRELAKIRTEGKGVGEVIVESPVEEEDTVPELPGPRARKVSTATEGERKRGFFKRHSSSATSPSQKAPSLGGLRRSVTGTISGKLGLRPKSLVVDTALAAQPPATSPVSPLSASAPTRLDVPFTRVRQPLSPTMHTRGSIIIHAEEIEDEESRRLAEAAFLDF
ncbi:hypothetical protein PsYK624_124630 [Phanerochaete sordida]|uniref:Uncharacterized protein n=1 Tax=Phanerochaete sordida TaxID=48140 RepID=A0A9P3GL57_9APHY|nr:hypothetical protein PsYK624_124630 [Phanerochaete sordida]